MRNSYSQHVGRQVVIQIGDVAIGGTIATASKSTLLLTDAALIERQPVPMDGQVQIPTAGIRWMQVLDG